MHEVSMLTWLSSMIGMVAPLLQAESVTMVVATPFNGADSCSTSSSD